jgi:hypothetical protein
MKIPLNNKAAKQTKAQAQTLCIKNETISIQKKQQLNIQLYQAHIHNAIIWQQT